MKSLPVVVFMVNAIKIWLVNSVLVLFFRLYIGTTVRRINLHEAACLL